MRIKKFLSFVSVGLLLGLLAGYTVNCQLQTSTGCPPEGCTPSCSDGVLTAPETDVDCGGNICAPCALAQKCQVGSDCQTGACVSGSCQNPSCTDGSKDSSESDVDCGGSCPACTDGKLCNGGSDCSSTLCIGGRCSAGSCTDGLKNGSESDVDCGGGKCPLCGLGKKCGGDGDCAAGFCDGGSCTNLGTGSDGPLAVPSGTPKVINTIASPVTGGQGTTSLTLTTPANFAVGQTLFIHQTQGSGAGNHELNRISAINGGVVTLARPLAFAYVTGAQSVVVPQYTTVSLADKLSAPAWNGATGGILVFQANSTVTLAATGNISMTGAGFRGGGDPVKCFPGSPGCLINLGRFGESEAGPSTFSSQNAAGGGDPNGSAGGGGTRGQDCAAGGGGSHGSPGTAGADGSIGACILNGKHGGGVAGNVVGAPDLTQSIFLGGGGGEGGPDEDGTHPGPGGNGGGIIVVYVGSLSLNATSVIDASGLTGQGGANVFAGCGGGGGGMGNGGGGAGGAIRIISGSTAALANNRITANGGAAGTGGGCGNGGVGGVGRIYVRASSAGGVTGTTVPPTF